MNVPKRFFAIGLVNCFLALYCVFLLSLQSIEKDIQLSSVSLGPYVLVEARDSDPISRKWIVYAITIQRGESSPPPIKARFYTYVASVYADVLTETEDAAFASIATAEIINVLAPSYNGRTDAFLDSLGVNSRSLSPAAQEILKTYVQKTSSHSDSPESWSLWIADNDWEPAVPPPPEKGGLRDQFEIAKLMYAVSSNRYVNVEKIIFWHGTQKAPYTDLAGIWQNVLAARTVHGPHPLHDEEYAQVQKILAQSITDAFISAWKIKHTYRTLTPSARIPDLDMLSSELPVSGYVSAHATVSTVAAEVLTALVPPDEQIWRQMALDAKNTGLLAGLHFDIDNDVGEYVGRTLGKHIASKISKHKEGAVIKTGKMRLENGISVVAKLLSIKARYMQYELLHGDPPRR